MLIFTQPIYINNDAKRRSVDFFIFYRPRFGCMNLVLKKHIFQLFTVLQRETVVVVVGKHCIWLAFKESRTHATLEYMSVLVQHFE